MLDNVQCYDITLFGNVVVKFDLCILVTVEVCIHRVGMLFADLRIIPAIRYKLPSL